MILVHVLLHLSHDHLLKLLVFDILTVFAYSVTEVLRVLKEDVRNLA